MTQNNNSWTKRTLQVVTFTKSVEKITMTSAFYDEKMTAEENSAMAWDYYLRIDTVTSVCLAYKL